LGCDTGSFGAASFRRYLREYRDVGGKREALIPPEQHLATTDLTTAEALLAERVRALEGKRRGRALGLDRPSSPLGPFVQEHLIAKRRAGRVTEGWIARSEVLLTRACEFFGYQRELGSIEVDDVERWLEQLRQRAGYRGTALKAASLLHHLHVLSNVFRRAQKLKLVPLGHNPVWALMEKPAVRRQEATWLDVPTAALVLEAAKYYRSGNPARAYAFIYPLVATFLLTGGRADEVLGLRVEDVSFERKTVRFCPTPFRRGKQGKSVHAERIIPVWPQLAEILGEYLVTRPPAQLLFPAWREGLERRVGDLRKQLRGITALAGLVADSLTTKVFRHTYCSARLATLDRGEPVSVDTVRREMGHGDEGLVRRIYGHLGLIRHRAAAVEYRLAQHDEALGDRLTAFRTRLAGTACDTDQRILEALEAKGRT
jgi:integrase